jgi:predicted patatin/cPLA2 family phospholipase
VNTLGVTPEGAVEQGKASSAAKTPASAHDTPFTVNVKDVALIFEGGGMRAAHTAGVVNTLLEQGLYFADVYGVSAGCTHTLNYLSQDSQRVRESFTGFMGHKGVAGIGQFLLGHGYFNARLIYQESGLPSGLLPFDFQRFYDNPARMHISSYQLDTNRTVYWTKRDVDSLASLMTMAQASSSMPLFMPTVTFQEHRYLDGGLGDDWGVMLEAARADGYERFFVVCTQKKGFRKQPPRPNLAIRLLLGRYPRLLYRMENRYRFYNQLYERLDQLAAEGKALVYHPQEIDIKSTTIDVTQLEHAYDQGYAQAQQELPTWLNFLGK